MGRVIEPLPEYSALTAHGLGQELEDTGWEGPEEWAPSTQPWGSPHLCWVQTSQCGYFKVTHDPAHNLSPIALSISLKIQLVAQGEFLWIKVWFAIGTQGQGQTMLTAF